MIIAAFEQGLCVGSLRISGNDHCRLEFPYEHYVNDRPIIEISKLIIAGSYRKTPLKNWIIQEAKQWIIEHYAPSYPESGTMGYHRTCGQVHDSFL